MQIKKSRIMTVRNTYMIVALTWGINSIEFISFMLRYNSFTSIESCNSSSIWMIFMHICTELMFSTYEPINCIVSVIACISFCLSKANCRFLEKSLVRLAQTHNDNNKNNNSDRTMKRKFNQNVATTTFL